MSFWNKLKSKPKEPVKLELSINKLKEKIADSLLNLNQSFNPKPVKQVINALSMLEASIESLMNHEVTEDYNKALMVGANNARKRIKTQLSPLIKLVQPIDLPTTNEFVKGVELLLNRAVKTLNESRRALLFYGSEMNDLSNSLTVLTERVNHLKKSVEPANNQLSLLTSLKEQVESLVNDLKELEEASSEVKRIKTKIKELKQDEQAQSKLVSSLKHSDSFKESIMVQQSLTELRDRKAKLEHLTLNVVSKFARALRKAFRDDAFIDQLLINPLTVIVGQEESFNKHIKRLIKELRAGSVNLNDKELKKTLSALNNHSIKDYLSEYKSLLEEEEVLQNSDSTVVNELRIAEQDLTQTKERLSQSQEKLKVLEEEVKGKESLTNSLLNKLELMASEAFKAQVRLVTN